ncbi:translocation/assembly module TamB domain-containing protein [Tropicibacter oceani]|uniref:Translocation/assembly module TamB domain-containing protein n=1 Tax=Tropicibacter oceani TaxID=3058420 RepID=A0ABY8QG94_9RHOB|nr:translocation/assembly module TamB domain-containing protein [Tropicibacter oceani]WGW03615.1 translocation/assembly module TamB domain-containing protein [Tropicibacter oceani]
MRWFLVACLVFLQTLAASAQEDKDRITRYLEEALSGAGRQVVVEGFRGALSSRATMDRLTIADDDGIWLTLTDAVLDWNRTAVLGGRIEINELSAAQIDLPRIPSGGDTASPEARAFSLPELPVSVRIDKIAVQRVVLGETVIGIPAVAAINGNMELADGQGNANLQITRLEGPRGEFTLAAGYSNLTKELSVDLNLTEAENGLAANLLNLPGKPALELIVNGAAPIDDYTADVVLRSGGQERLVGQVSTQAADTADTDPRLIRVDIAGDLAPLFVPQYQAFFGPEVALKSRIALYPDGRVTLDELSATSAALRLNGTFSLSANGLPEAFRLDAALLDPDGAPVLLPMSGPETRVGMALITASFDSAKGDAWTLVGDLKELRRDEVTLEALQLETSGTIRNGTARQVTARIDASAQGVVLTDPKLQQALGSLIDLGADIVWQEGAPIRFENLDLVASGLNLSGDGTLDGLDSNLTLDGTIRASVQDLSRLSALAGQDLRGAIKADLAGQATLLTGAFDLALTATGDDLSVGMADLDDLLSGSSQLDLSALRTTEGLTIRRANIALRGLSASGAGKVATEQGELTVQGALQASIQDLSRLSALAKRDLRGSLDADLDGKATLTTGAFDLTLSTTGNDLAVGIADVDDLLVGPSRLDVSALRDATGLTLRQAQVTTRGLSANGAGRVASGDSDVTFSADLARTEGFAPSLTGPSRVSGRAVQNAEGWRVTLDGTAPRAITLTADLDLPTKGDPSATFDARIGSLAWVAPELAGPGSIRGRAQRSGSQWVVDTTASGPGGITADLAGQIAQDAKTAALGVTGRLPLGLANRRLGANSVQGMAQVDLRLDGPLTLSSLSGQITTSDSRLAVPALRNALKGIEATVTLNAGQADFDARGKLDSGGTIRTDGRVRLQAPFVTEAEVILKGVKITDPELYETHANGTLRLSGSAPANLALSGQLVLDETEIRVPSTGIGSYGAVPDITHLNEPGGVRRTRSYAGLLDVTGAAENGGGVAVGLDVEIVALNRIFVRGRGLDAELGGQLRLTGSSADVIPQGRFDLIRGRLDILGKRLILEEGSARLQGDLVPMLRLVARTTADDTVVYVTIEGPADSPEIKFESDPALPEDEVLARLLFGRGVSSISALQAVQLASAVATLAGQGGVGIVERLRQTTGFDDLDVTTDENGAATLRVGKYISENAYTDVEIDSSGQSRINLNLDLTPSTKLRGQVGSDGGTGIGLFFERDY